MRGDDGLGVLEKWAWVGRFLGEYVQRYPAQFARFQPGQQRGLVHQFTPGYVDDTGAGLDVLYLAHPQHSPGAFGQRGVQGDEVGLGQQFIQRQQLDADAAGVVRGDEGVVAHQPHPEGLGAAGHLGADPPQAADAQGLVAHLDAHEGAAPPLARLQRVMSAGDVAGQSQHQGDGMLGGGHGVAGGGVDHGDAGAGGGFQVDVVHTDAGAGDDLQLLASLDYVAVDLGLAADHQGLVAPHGVQQLGGLHARLDVYVGPGFEEGDTLGAYWVGN